MFEASVNRQFKSRFSSMNGVVHMGPISVLRRIFNGHSIDGYVLSNNFEEQLVVMKKKEFETLCKYIKVDIERTSNIPRAKLIKERGMRGIDLSNSGGMNPNALIPYQDVTCGSYSNYLNNAYLSQIQPYTHMILRGMNFSHYEVISKAMHSNMANAINQAYEKYGGNINNVLSKRSYNAEEYEVALLAVAYIGIEELNPNYLRVVCANDGSGAKAMKNKLDKYREMSKKVKEEKLEVQKEDNNNKEIQKEELDVANIELVNKLLNWYVEPLSNADFINQHTHSLYRGIYREKYVRDLEISNNSNNIPIVSFSMLFLDDYNRDKVADTLLYKVYRENENNSESYNLIITAKSNTKLSVKTIKMPFKLKKFYTTQEVKYMDSYVERYIKHLQEDIFKGINVVEDYFMQNIEGYRKTTERLFETLNDIQLQREHTMDKLYDENIKRKLRQEQQEHERRERQALIEEQERKRKEKEQAAMQYRILNQEIKSTKEDTYDLTDKYWYRKMFRKYPNRFLSLYTTCSEGTGFVYITNNGLPYKLVIKDTVLTVDDLYVPDSIAMICYGDGSDRRGNIRLRGWKRAEYEYLSAEERDLKLFEFCELTIEGMNSLDESYMSTEEKDSYHKLGKKSNVNLFDNQDTSDFSDFSPSRSDSQIGRTKGVTKVDPFATKDERSEKAFEELAKQFQFF